MYFGARPRLCSAGNPILSDHDKTMKPIKSLTDDELAGLVKGAAALPDAPAALVKSAIGLWQAAHPATAPATLAAGGNSLLHKIRAVLTFDSWSTAPAALGLRSMPSQTRHMMFSAQGRDIDLRIVSSAESFVLAGQILGPDETGLIELAVDTTSEHAAQTLRTTTLDELGAFRLDNVHAGTYWMTLKLAGDAVELPPIDVGDRRQG